MIKDFNVKPGIGIDKIKLGITKQQLIDIIGEPEEIDDFTQDDGEQSDTLLYNKLGIDFTFESCEDFKLCYISMDGANFHLDNFFKIGDKKDDILQNLQTLDWDEPVIDDVSSDEVENHILFSFYNQNVDLWFIDDILDEIQIGPLWKDDETPIWPE